MGGADGAGLTTAAAAVDRFNFRRTPIVSEDVKESSDPSYWRKKEAEYDSLDPRSQAQLSTLVRMAPVSLLENDWNHLGESSIPGLESTPFKQLNQNYPKLLDKDGGFLARGPQDFFSIRHVFGNPSTGAFRNGPVFGDTRVEGNMFDEFLVQQAEEAKNGNIRDGVIYASLNDEVPDTVPESVTMVLPGLQQESGQQIIRDMVQLRVSGFDARMEVGHFVVPVNTHEPQPMHVVDRPIVHNRPVQPAPLTQSRWHDRFQHNNTSGNHHNNHNHQHANGNNHYHGNHHHHYHHNNNNMRGRRGGFMNNRFNGGGRQWNDQRNRANNGCYQNQRAVVRCTTPVAPVVATPPRASPGQENRREQLVPIQVVVVDNSDMSNTSSYIRMDANGEYYYTDGYRQWQRKRSSNGVCDGSTPNKIHFNRNL